MTEQTQSSADIAARALEEAKARLSPEEFRLFVYCFNVQYIVVRMQTTDGFDPKIINLLIDGLVSPLMDHYASVVGLLDKKDEFLLEARAVVLEAFAAAVVPNESPADVGVVNEYPGIYGLIIDRARQEGFEVPTLEEIAAADENRTYNRTADWDALYAAERFHFQSALRLIITRNTVPFKFTKKAEA